MHREIEDLQPKLKEILYDCVTDVRATKAALYLLDRPANRYELVTEYGFKGSIRPTADSSDPIVDRCAHGPTPFFVNSLTEEPRYSELLFVSNTEHLLVAPIYVRRQLVGFVDMRDKAGRAAFDLNDPPKAQRVAERIGELFLGEANPFGQRYITISGNEPLPSILTGVYSANAQPQAQPAPAPTPTPPPQPAKSGAVIVPEILRTILFIPGAIVAAFVSPSGQLIVARAPLSGEAFALFDSKIRGWLAKRGEMGTPLRNEVQTPLGPGVAAIRDTDIKKVFTAAVTAGAARGLYLSVGFAVEPELPAHELLAALHKYLQLALERS